MIIGLEVRHYKAYKNINFIPIGNEHNFIAFAGENGVGKSSILEALDTFLNDRDWLLTKQQTITESYIAPVFLIPKTKVKKLKSDFEAISNFFWNLEKKEKKHVFFDIRDSLDENTTNTHYLIFLGQKHGGELKIPFGAETEKSFDEHVGSEFVKKKFLKELKDIYSYVYIPVEINSENFTKIETEEMQKIFNKKIKDEIGKSVSAQEITRINTKLDEFVSTLEKKLEGRYYYDTGDESTKQLTQKSLADTILEIYFKKRVLMSGSRERARSSKKMRELSAGEKREALINLIYVFLKEEEERDQIVIIGIDEPENSLHTALCYDQFEKLKRISQNAQVLITTHWYGFLPIIDKGMVHFLKTGEDRVNFFEKADLYLYPYRTKKIPEDFSLKSTNDLVQSIFHSLKTKNPYNWLICEGSSDKIYLEYFLKNEVGENNLKIIPVGGIELVKKFYKYLLLPISENIHDIGKGRVFCLTDTDSNLRKNDISDQDKNFKNTLVIKRFASEGMQSPSLIKFEAEQKQDSIDIEKSLHPIIFEKTLKNLSVANKFLIEESSIQIRDGSTTKDNLRNFDIDNYFDSEAIKDSFAKKYISLMDLEENPEDYIPKWVTEIREFFSVSV